MSSNLGQTYFIAIFAPWLKSELKTPSASAGLVALPEAPGAAALRDAGRVGSRLTRYSLFFSRPLPLSTSSAYLSPTSWK